MKTFALCFLALTCVPFAGVLHAGENGSLLARLDAECRSLAARADAATVEVRPERALPNWMKLPGPRDPATAARYYRWTVDRSNQAVVARATPGALITGVLVGSPPVVVTSAAAVGGASVISVRLADGTEATAKLLGRDAELGVAVFTLPESIATGRRSLSVDRSEKVDRGQLVLVAGSGSGPLGLAVARGGSPLVGWFKVDGLPEGPRPGQPALGVDGRLLGIAAGAVRTSAPIQWPSLLTYYRGGKVELASPHQYVGQPREKSPPDGQKPKEPSEEDPAKKGGWIADAWGNPLAYFPSNDHAPPDAGAFISGSVIGRVLDDLAAHGRVRHSYLGVVLGQVRGQGDSRGVAIRSVLEDSPAAKAGLRTGYLIRTVNGEEVLDPGRLGRVLVHRRPGETIRIRVAGSTAEFVVVLGDRTAAERRLVTPEDLGLSCLDLGRELARFLGQPEGTRGVVVRDVRPGSAAAGAGISRGQIIVGGGGEPIADLEELRAAVAGAKGSIVLDVRSGTKKAVARSVPIAPRRVGSGAR